MIERNMCAKCFAQSAQAQGRPWLSMSVMVVCTICGNKRCPKASNHANQCSGSNSPNQEAAA